MGKEPGLQQFGEGAETPLHHYFSPILIPKKPKTHFYQESHQPVILGYTGEVSALMMRFRKRQPSTMAKLLLAGPSLNPITDSLAIIKARLVFQAVKEEQENNLSILQTLLKIQFPPCRSCSTTA